MTTLTFTPEYFELTDAEVEWFAAELIKMAELTNTDEHGREGNGDAMVGVPVVRRGRGGVRPVGVPDVIGNGQN